MQNKQECGRVTELLADYGDDLLEPVDKKLVEEHLAVCGECRLELERYRRMAVLLKDSGYEPPPAMKENVAEKIKRYNRRAAVRRGIVRYGSLAAAALVVGAAAIRFTPIFGKVPAAAILDKSSQAAVVQETFAEAAPTAETAPAADTAPAAENAPAEVYEDMILYSADADEMTPEAAPEAAIGEGAADENASSEGEAAGDVSEAPMLASLFMAPSAASAALPDDAGATDEASEAANELAGEIVPEEQMPAPVPAAGAASAAEDASGAEAAYGAEAEEDAAPDMSLPMLKSARMARSAPTAQAETALKPLIFQDKEDRDRLLSEYAPEYKYKALHVFVALYKLDENAGCLAGFEKVEKEGYDMYVSSSFEAWQNAVAALRRTTPAGFRMAVIAEENDGMLYDVIFDFND